MVFSYINKFKVTRPSENFFKRWGCFYLEFKHNKGFLSSLYYLVYFGRRVEYALVQIYLNSYLILQSVLNFAFSLATLLFLIYYRPFKDSGVLITNIAGEIATTIVMGLSITFLWEINKYTQEIIEMIIIGIVLLSMLIQMSAFIFSMYESLHFLWLKYEKVRSISFVQSFSVKTVNISTINI